MNIISLLNQIENDEIVLPAIQRNFVWEEEKIQTLMDSIVRGYPIGIVLMWETYKDIQYRYFEKNFIDGNRPTFHDNTQNKKLKIVLDGQQRLQSLYIALYGKYEGHSLYFDVLSGRESEDFKEEKYFFYFSSSEEAEKWNNESFENIENQEDKLEDDYEIEYFVKVIDLFSMTGKKKRDFRKKISIKLKLDDENEGRLEANFAKLDEVLVKDENILKTSVIDENITSNSPERKSDSDVLEIFVRINRLGTPLSRSDLIFSMLKLNWKDSATALPEFVDSVNKGNSFIIDIDFVIRCLFTVSDLGTKFDIDILRKKQNMEKIKQNFQQCCEAIRSVVDTIQRECWIASSKALGNYHTLVPFVYYLYHTPKHQLPNSEIANFRKALYLFGFTTPFSRYADSRLGKFIKEEIKPLIQEGNYAFPYSSAISWVNYWEGIGEYGPAMIQRNAKLALYVVQRYTGSKTHYKPNAQEMDHIFPRSILRSKDRFDESEINHFANFWILSKGKNQNKSNKHPKKYFADITNTEMKKALIDRDMLDYRFYRKFLNQRGEKILAYVKKKVGFKDDDFSINEED